MIVVNKMKNKFSNNNVGFTMIELIVVLVVLAIMAAFTVPSLSGFVEDAKAKDCRSKVNDIKRLYIDAVIDKGEKHPKQYESFYIIDKIIIDKYGGKTQERETEEDVDKTGSKKEKIYTGICPSGGSYLISFDNPTETDSTKDDEDEKDTDDIKAETKLLISCSCEGHTEDKASISRIGIRTIVNEINKKDSEINKYFKNHKGSTLDSTGKNYAPVIQDVLDKLGIDTKNTSSWRVVPNGNDYDIYWTETNISNLPDGTEIYVTKYNYSTKKFYYGKTTVGSHSDGANSIKHINVDNVDWKEV